MKIVAALRTPRVGAVEMPPRGKRGSRLVGTHSFHRAWKSGKGRPDSHISTAPTAGSILKKGARQNEEKTEFQLTDSITSSRIRTPASLRSENDQLHLGTSDRDHIGITNHLHRNKHGEMGKPPARWRHGGLLLCPSADGHPPGLRFPQETNRTAKFLGSPAKRQPLALASRPHSPFSCPARNGRRKGEKTNDRANQTDQSRSI